MKKVFQFKDEKKHEERVLEAVKHEIRKYVKREKKKTLEDAKLTYWDFDCKIGATAESAAVVEFNTLIKALDEIKARGATECYVEIVAKVVDKPLRDETNMEDITTV